MVNQKAITRPPVEEIQTLVEYLGQGYLAGTRRPLAPHAECAYQAIFDWLRQVQKQRPEYKAMHKLLMDRAHGRA
jgi:hypothetical protein